MPLPTFASPATPEPSSTTVTRTQAAARLQVPAAGVDKLLKAGMLSTPIRDTEIERLAGRERLRVESGALTVLRTNSREVADRAKYPGDPRRWMGFHVEHSDAELEDASLRWWRSDPQKVLDNELFVVTIATFPVAVYRILQRVDTVIRADEERPRHHYRGELLARVHPGMSVTYPQNTPGHLRALAQQIMASRVVVSSGGPIGYLEQSFHLTQPTEPYQVRLLAGESGCSEGVVVVRDHADFGEHYVVRWTRKTDLGPAGYWQVPKSQVDEADRSSVPGAVFVPDPHLQFDYPLR